MEPSKRRPRNAGSIVPKTAELIVHRQSDSGTIRRLLKDQEIAEQFCAIADRPSSLISPDSDQRVYDPPVDPNLAKASGHSV